MRLWRELFAPSSRASLHTFMSSLRWHKKFYTTRARIQLNMSHVVNSVRVEKEYETHTLLPCRVHGCLINSSGILPRACIGEVIHIGISLQSFESERKKTMSLKLLTLMSMDSSLQGNSKMLSLNFNREFQFNPEFSIWNERCLNDLTTAYTQVKSKKTDDRVKKRKKKSQSGFSAV